MKFYYHFTNLIYDFNNSKFIDIEYQEVLQFLKLAYKNPECFKIQFLDKIKEIPNLSNLRSDLMIDFEKAISLNLSQIENLKSEQIKIAAKKHYENYFQNHHKEKSDLHLKFINKIASFLNEDEFQFVNNLDSEFVKDKTFQKIRNIDYYEITDKNECIELYINNIKNLKLNKFTKHLVCQDCNIQSIELNNCLQTLDANNNKLLKIELNRGLIEANLLFNPIQYVKLNENLTKLYVSNPENKFIKIDNSVGNNQVEINYFIN